MTQALLFPEIPTSTRARILVVLGDPNLSPSCASVLRALMYAAGRQSAISISQIQVGCHWLSDRDIKAAVKELLEVHGVAIGSARSAPFGYFLLCSQDDIEQAERPILAEVRSLARRLRAINPDSDISRMLCGQLEL